MTYYSAHYGSWNEKGGVKQVAFGIGEYGTLCSTCSRKEAFEKPQTVADEVRREVTVLSERPTGCGLELKSYTVQPRIIEV